MGTTCEVRLPKDLNIRMSGCESCMIATIWKQLATNAMDNTIRDFLALRLKMQLCDWAYLNLIDTFAKAFCGHGNEAVIMAAFIYSQSGYKMRLGRDCEKLYLLYGSKHGIYEKGILSLKVSITILLMIRLKEWRFQISLSRKSNLCLCI